MYQKVKHAWVVLDANQISQLYVMFVEHPAEANHNGGRSRVESTQPFCEVYPNGIVKHARYTTGHDYYKTRYITEDGTKINPVAIREVTLIPEPLGGYDVNGILITKEFAEQILKEFNLPFHLEEGVRHEYDDGLVLVQDDPESLVGTTVESPGYGPVRVLAHCVGDAIQVMNNEWFTVDIGDGQVRYLRFNNLPGIYRGITSKQFYTEMRKLCAAK